jgi:D-galactarolactone cycloisomerase
LSSITDISFIGLLAPLPHGKAYGMSKSLATARQATLVVIKTEAGMEGIGEAWGVPQVNVAYLPLLKSYLIGADVTDVELVFARILARHYHFGLQNQMMACLSGIDIAAKDAVGKETGLPVCRLIGGRGNDRVPIYASGGYLTEQPQRDFPAQIEAMAEAAYPTVKIKIGLGPKSDLERVAFARNRLGGEVDILVDINSNYTVDLARASIARLAEYRIGWVEEPLAPQALTAMRVCAKQVLSRSRPARRSTRSSISSACSTLAASM